MPIQRRVKGPPIEIELADLLKSKDEEKDPYRDFREMLEAEEAVLKVRRCSGEEADAMGRDLTAVQLEMKKLDLAYRKEHGIQDTEHPDSGKLLLAAYERIFGQLYIELTGFEAVHDAPTAWAAIFDFLPVLNLIVGSAVLTRQRPTRPES